MCIYIHIYIYIYIQHTFTACGIQFSQLIISLSPFGIVSFFAIFSWFIPEPVGEACSSFEVREPIDPHVNTCLMSQLIHSRARRRSLQQFRGAWADWSSCEYLFDFSERRGQQAWTVIRFVMYAFVGPSSFALRRSRNHSSANLQSAHCRFCRAYHEFSGMFVAAVRTH